MSLGITGHRSNRISRAQLDALTPALVTLMTQIAALAPGDGRLWLTSALADGADQHAARIALDAGWALHAVLPFDDAGCEAECADTASRFRFRSLLQRAGRITRLHGRVVRPDQAYRQLGRAVVEASDLLVAVWDGEPARGPGGTAEVVAEALWREKPVVHLRPADDPAPSLLWQVGGAETPPVPFGGGRELLGVLNALHARGP